MTGNPPVRRGVRAVAPALAAVVLVGLGEHVGERFVPVYLLALGGSVLLPGLFNGVTQFLSALYAFGGGWISHRIGVRRALVAFSLAAAGGFLVVSLVPAWPAVFAGSVLFVGWSSLTLPPTMALIARALPSARRTFGVSLHALLRRIPMAAGPLAGGALIGAFGVVTGMRVAFGVAAALALLAAVLQHRFIPTDAVRGSGGGEPVRTAEGPVRLFSAMPAALRHLLAADILVRFCEQIPAAYVVVWCVQRIGAPVTGFQFGLLTAIEMAVATLIYLPVAAAADRAGKRPFVAVTFGFFTIFPVVLYHSRSFWPLVAAFAVRGLKEFGEPARKAMILDLAPARTRAATFGTYYLVRDTVVTVSAVAGAWLWEAGPGINLGAACCCGAAGTAWFLWRCRT
jgi:MFS family permease